MLVSSILNLLHIAAVLSAADLSVTNNNRQQQIKRDGSLADLAKILNYEKELFMQWADTEGDYVKLLKVIHPWIIGDSSRKLTIKPLEFSKSLIDCANDRYSNVLSGDVAPEPQYIVDFIPFGYDIDKLEIRFYELYNVVDLFVVYESQRTLSSMPKYLYFREVMNTLRFAPYMKKVLYLNASISEVEKYTSIYRSDRTGRGQNSWALVKAMRTEMMRLFIDVKPGVSHLRDTIMRNIDKAYGIQNDADEMAKGLVLLHLKHCLVKPTVHAIYLPCFSFKKNFHWLQHTTDLQCLGGRGVSAYMDQAKGFLWRPGPIVWPLATFIKKSDTLRDHSHRLCKNHMGLGAASHLSSTAEPAEYILKRCGVNEQSFRGTVTSELITAGRKGTITPEIIFRATIHPWCPSSGRPAMHVSQLNPEVQRLVYEAIPDIVLHYPDLYPYMLPGNASVAKAGLFAECADPAWANKCKLNNASSY